MKPLFFCCFISNLNNNYHKYYEHFRQNNREIIDFFFSCSFLCKYLCFDLRFFVVLVFAVSYKSNLFIFIVFLWNNSCPHLGNAVFVHKFDRNQTWYLKSKSTKLITKPIINNNNTNKNKIFVVPLNIPNSSEFGERPSPIRLRAYSLIMSSTSTDSNSCNSCSTAPSKGTDKLDEIIEQQKSPPAWHAEYSR